MKDGRQNRQVKVERELSRLKWIREAQVYQFKWNRRTEVQWLCWSGHRWWLISPGRLRIRPPAEQRTEVEQWRRRVAWGNMGLNSHSALDCPSPCLQRPRDLAAMSLLVRASTAKKSVQRPRQELVRDPNVVLCGRIERVRCSTAGNGRALHQVSWA